MNNRFLQWQCVCLFGLLFVLSSCSCADLNANRSSEKEPEVYTLNLQDEPFIQMSKEIEVSVCKEMPVFQSKRTLLSPQLFFNFFSSGSDEIDVRNLDDGCISLLGDSGYAQIIMSDFYYYGVHNKKNGTVHIPFDPYSELLCCVQPTPKGMRYAYLPNQYLSSESLDFSSEKLTQFLDRNINLILSKPLDYVVYRTEIVSENGIQKLLDENALSSSSFDEISPFYRIWGEFTLENIPVLSPRNELVCRSRVDGIDVCLPYIEAVANQQGVLYVAIKDLPVNVTEKCTIYTSSPQEALEIFLRYFEDLNLTEETAIFIDDISPCYVAEETNDGITYEPAWKITYQQKGCTKNLCVRMETGDML